MPGGSCVRGCQQLELCAGPSSASSQAERGLAQVSYRDGYDDRTLTAVYEQRGGSVTMSFRTVRPSTP